MKAFFDLNTGQWREVPDHTKPTSTLINLGPAIDWYDKRCRQEELARQRLAAARRQSTRSSQDQSDDLRAALYLNGINRDALSSKVLERLATIEAAFDATGEITGLRLGILRRCYWRSCDFKDDWKYPSFNLQHHDSDSALVHYGPSETPLMEDEEVERVNNYLGNMRRLAIGSDMRKTVESIEDQFIIDGTLSYKQLDLLRRLCLLSNGIGSRNNLSDWKANYQGLQG